MRFKVKDNLGRIFDVKDEEEKTEVPCNEETEDCKDAEPVEETLTFTEEEVKTLKKLIANSEKLLEILTAEKEEKAEEVEETEEPEESNEVEEVEETETEEVEEKEEFDDELEIGTDALESDEEVEEETEVKDCEDIMVHDSKKSFGSLMRKDSSNDDDELSLEDEVAQAWSKRYGGK